MTAAQIVGLILLLLGEAAIFGAMCAGMGFWTTLTLWVGSFAITGLMVLGVLLLTGSISFK